MIQIRLPRLGHPALQVGSSLLDHGALAVTNLLFQIYLARNLQVASYGAAALAFTALLVLTGAHSALVAEPLSVLGPSRHPERLPEYLRSCLPLHRKVALLSSLGSVAAAAPIYFFHPELGLSLFGLALTAPAYLTFSFVRRAAYALGRPGIAVQATAFFTGFIALFVAILALSSALTAFSAVVAFGLAAGASATAGLRTLRLPTQHARETGPATWRNHWAYGRWIFAANLFHWMGSGSYLFLVGLLTGVSGAGVFRAAQNLLAPVQHGTLAVATLILPLLAGAGAAGARSALRVTWGLVLSASILYAALLWAWAGAIVDLLYGVGRYSEISTLVPAMSALILFFGSTQVFSLMLRSRERPAPVLVAKIASALAVLSLGVPLTLRHGLVGAAWGQCAAVAAEGAILLLALIAGRRG